MPLLAAAINWPTLFASAGVSAVVGSVVSLIAVSSVTVRTERAKRREAARVALKQAVQPLLADLARYQFSDLRTSAKREGNSLPLEDYETVVKIREAALGLSALRRSMVDHRCREIFGRSWVQLAEDYPAGASGGLGAYLASATNSRGNEPHDGASSLFHRTYSKPPSQGGGKALRRQLRLLSKAR